MQDDLSTLAVFVLETVEHLRAITGAQAAEPALAGLHIREVTFSIPYDPGPGMLLLRAPVVPGGLADTPELTLASLAIPIVRLPQALELLRTLDPRVVFDRARLVEVSDQRLARLEITIQL